MKFVDNLMVVIMVVFLGAISSVVLLGAIIIILKMVNYIKILIGG